MTDPKNAPQEDPRISALEEMVSTQAEEITSLKEKLSSTAKTVSAKPTAARLPTVTIGDTKYRFRFHAAVIAGPKKIVAAEACKDAELCAQLLADAPQLFEKV